MCCMCLKLSVGSQIIKQHLMSIIVCDYGELCIRENKPPAAFYSINGDCEALNCSQAAAALISKS